MNRLFVLLWILLPLCFRVLHPSLTRTHIHVFLPSRHGRQWQHSGLYPLATDGQGSSTGARTERTKQKRTKRRELRKVRSCSKMGGANAFIPYRAANRSSAPAWFVLVVCESMQNANGNCDGGCLHVRG